MGITISIAGGGAAVGFDWGAAIVLGISAIVAANNRNRGNNNEDDISSRVMQNLRENLTGREELTQTIYQSQGYKRSNNVSLLSPPPILPLNNCHLTGREELTQTIYQSQDYKRSNNVSLLSPPPILPLNNCPIFDKKEEDKNINSIEIRNDRFFGYGNLDFDNYVKFKVFCPPSSQNIIVPLEYKPKYTNSSFCFKPIIDIIKIAGESHITDLLIENIRNRSYNWNEKMDPEILKKFQNKNLSEINRIKIFNKICTTYNIIEKSVKITSIIMDENKKKSHKELEVSSEGIKIAAHHYFCKNYFLKTLKKVLLGMKKVKKIYNDLIPFKCAKIGLEVGIVGTVGTGIFITYLFDCLIEGVCNISTKELEKFIDECEKKKKN